MQDNNILVTGATGMIGGLVVRLALEHPEVAGVTTLGRRILGIDHPKLREIKHGDFMDFSAVQHQLTGHNVALFCLGVYTGSVPDEEFRRITVDLTVAFAEAFVRANPGAAFCFLSGAGADPTGKSRMAFARYKGEAETILQQMGFARLHIFRPGYIYPVTPREEPNLFYRILRPLYPILRRIYPNLGIASDDLARAMLQAGLEGTPGQEGAVLENRDIRRMVGQG